jgi:hypothetical protein
MNKKLLITLGIVGLITLGSFYAMQVQADTIAVSPTVTPNTFRYYRFFATSTAQTDFSTSTIATAATNYATSTSITQWMNGDGAVDNGYFVVAGAKAIEFSFGRGATSTNVGTSDYYIQVTSKPAPSETDWFTYTGLVPATTTSATPTFVQIAQQAAATSTIKFTMNNLNETIYAVRCITVIKVDGNNTCAVAASF